MSRKYYPFYQWEDYKSGVYKTPKQLTEETGISSEERVKAAIDCLTHPDMLKMFMRKVTGEWKIASEQVLSGTERRISWLGQCACFMYGGCSDEETRKAWGLIAQPQRDAANKVAQSVIDEWEADHEEQLRLF